MSAESESALLKSEGEMGSAQKIKWTWNHNQVCALKKIMRNTPNREKKPTTIIIAIVKMQKQWPLHSTPVCAQDEKFKFRLWPWPLYVSLWQKCMYEKLDYKSLIKAGGSLGLKIVNFQRKVSSGFLWKYVWSGAYYTVTPQKWLHRRSRAEPPNFRSLLCREYLRDFHDFLWDELAKSKAFSCHVWFMKYSSISILAVLREFTWLTTAHV